MMNFGITKFAAVSAMAIGLAIGANAAHAASDDIVDTAVSAGSFQTLAAALEAAGLVETLKGEGPFTVFAPTDDAFAKLPEGTVDNLLKPENKDQLTKVLTAHVVAGDLSAEELMRRARNHGGRYNFNAVSGDLAIHRNGVNVRFQAGLLPGAVDNR